MQYPDAMFGCVKRRRRRAALDAAGALGLVLVSSLWGLHAQEPSASTADELYRAGYAAYQQGDLPTAHKRFAQLVLLAPQVAVGHVAYGEVLLAQGEAAAALKELESAHRLDPNAAATEVAIGNALLALAQPANAVNAFQEGVAKGAVFSPGDSSSYAAALAAAGQPDQAITVLAAVLQSSPRRQPALTASETASMEDSWGTLLAQRSRFDQAIEHFAAATAAVPEMAAAHAHLGSAELALHRPEVAVVELRRAVALDPDQLLYSIQLGRALSASGEDAEAVSLLRQAVAGADKACSAPSGAATRSQARYALALALQAGGQPGEALALLREYAVGQPKDAEAQTNYALALVQTGDARQALPLYQQALAHGPDNATLREDYGVAYLQQSDLDHALAQFRAGLALEPENPHLHYDLGLAYKLKDDLAAAVPEFEHAEQLDPTLPDPTYTLGVIHMQQGEFQAAAAELEKTVALQASNEAAWSVLGNVYKEDGQPAKAAAALKRAIELDPSQPSTHITLAAILAQGGDQPGAAAERKQAAELSRAAVSRQRASFALKSGRALLDQGLVKAAEAQLRTAIAADPRDPAAHQALAEALGREGLAADAALERQQAVSLAARGGAKSTASPAHE